MGREATCVARVGRRHSEGKALLESTEIIFRGEFKLTILFRDIRSIAAREGRLEIETADERFVFELGREAGAWAERIRKPKSRLDKLGVKPGMRVAVIGVDDPEFDRELGERVGAYARRRVSRGSDLVFFGATRVTDLVRLAKLRAATWPAGAIWVVWPKGRPELREDDVRRAAKAAGLVDVKVAAFSATLSALKLVIPVRER